MNTSVSHSWASVSWFTQTYFAKPCHLQRLLVWHFGKSSRYCPIPTVPMLLTIMKKSKLDLQRNMSENNKVSPRQTQVDTVACGSERGDTHTSFPAARSHSHLLKTTSSLPGQCLTRGLGERRACLVLLQFPWCERSQHDLSRATTQHGEGRHSSCPSSPYPLLPSMQDIELR